MLSEKIVIEIFINLVSIHKSNFNLEPNRTIDW